MLVLIFDHLPQAVVGYDYWVVPYYTPVFRTIIICRFLLTLKTVYYDDVDHEESQVGSLKFAARVVGSMGAPVDVDPIRFADGNEENDDDEIIFSRDPFTTGMMSRRVHDGKEATQEEVNSEC